MAVEHLLEEMLSYRDAALARLSGDNAGHRNVQAHCTTAQHDALQAEASRKSTTISKIVEGLIAAHTGKD